MELQGCDLMTICKKNYETLELDEDKSWVTLYLNRPAAKNALSEKMIEELTEVLDRIANSKTIRGLALKGANNCFCAGADLKEFEKNFVLNNPTRGEIIKLSTNVALLLKRIHTMPQVVVSLVDGPAFAGGFGLVCCSDFVLGTKNAQFSISETKIGLIPAQITPYIVERIGRRNAKKLMISGSRFDSHEACDYGVIDVLVNNEIELNAEFALLQKRLMECAPEAIAFTKEITDSYDKLESEEVIRFLANKFADCVEGEEAKEGLQAFIRKRKPKWTEL